MTSARDTWASASEHDRDDVYMVLERAEQEAATTALYFAEQGLTDFARYRGNDAALIRAAIAVLREASKR